MNTVQYYHSFHLVLYIFENLVLFALFKKIKMTDETGWKIKGEIFKLSYYSSVFLADLPFISYPLTIYFPRFFSSTMMSMYIIYRCIHLTPVSPLSLSLTLLVAYWSFKTRYLGDISNSTYSIRSYYLYLQTHPFPNFLIFVGFITLTSNSTTQLPTLTHPTCRISCLILPLPQHFSNLTPSFYLHSNNPFQAHFISCQDYCNGVLIGLSTSNFSPFQSILHRDAEAIFLKPSSDHVTSLFNKLQWLLTGSG